MGQTRYYDLAFFDFGDKLSTPVSVQKEIDRFVVIDKQIYGMYKIFGNGVIDGFTVRDAGFQEANGITVSISEGIGVVNYLASVTEEPGFVYGLPPNSIVDIYATISGATYLDRTVNFVYSDSPLEEAIRLATVSTGGNNILFIDNTTRDLIGFEQIIQDAINLHKHRGTPSKIDLANETKNQLSGARLEGIDASKVVSGRFDIDRIPLVDHNDLENNGLLTHAALDSFIKTFSQNNKELLGEIASVNLLKSIVFWKYKYSNADEFFINELTLIPGISPNSFIDFNNSTANISLEEHCISGIPAKSGIFSSVLWNDTFSFNTATFQNNVIIQDDTVSIDRSSSSTDLIANFTGGNPFETETLVVDNNQQASTTVSDGDFIGQMGGGGTLNYFYRYNFAEGKNWDGTYDELVIKVRTTETIHEPVYMYLVNGSNLNNGDVSSQTGVYGSLEVGNINGKRVPTASWQILAQDENMSSLTEKVFDISDLGLTDVTQITIFTEDSFTFEVDDIEVRRTNMFSESGTIKFQYQTEANVIFHSVFYDIDTPSGTTASVRMKIASTSDLLSQASWSLPVNSGDVVSLSGTATELEVVMTSNTERTLSPVLSNLELRLLIDADYTGFVIDTESEWSGGDSSNLTINDSEETGKSILNISSPINVGGRYFAKSGSVSEINDEDVGVYGFSGNLMPVSPSQARDWNSSSSRGFSVVSSVIRLFDNSFLISDLNNNRVVQVDSDGSLIKGFGSTYSIDTNFYPLSAVYRPTDKILTIVFTKAAVISDISKISLYVGSSKVSLSSDDTVLKNNKASNKILEILLDDDTAVRLLGATSKNLTVDFGPGAFTEEIIMNSDDTAIAANLGMSSQGNSIFSALKGLVCFVGDFTYIDNIRHPIVVKETSENYWIIGNSSVFYIDIDPDKEEERGIPDIIEIDPENVSNTTNKFSSSDIKFSDYTLGGIYEYSDGRFVVAGLETTATALSGTTGEDLLAQYEEPIPESVKFRAAGIDDLSGYAGRVVVIDKINNRKQILYSSPDGLYPSEVDGYSNGDLAISESSLSDTSGRLIRIDVFGNIIWNYGAGTFHIINDVRVLEDDKLIVSV